MSTIKVVLLDKEGNVDSSCTRMHVKRDAWLKLIDKHGDGLLWSNDGEKNIAKSKERILNYYNNLEEENIQSEETKVEIQTLDVKVESYSEKLDRYNFKYRVVPIILSICAMVIAGVGLIPAFRNTPTSIDQTTPLEIEVKVPTQKIEIIEYHTVTSLKDSLNDSIITN